MYSAVVLSMITLFFGAMITSYYDAKKLIMHTCSNPPSMLAINVCESMRATTTSISTTGPNKEKAQTVRKSNGSPLNSESASRSSSFKESFQNQSTAGSEVGNSFLERKGSGDAGSQESLSYLTQKSNPDGSKGFLLRFNSNIENRDLATTPSLPSQLRVNKCNEAVANKRYFHV